MTTTALAGVGIAGIALGILTFRINVRMERRGKAPRFWFPLRMSSVIVGMLAGVASWPLTYWMGYGVDEPGGLGRVVGLPFMAAYFDSAGLDYVGPITLPAVIANAVFWFLAPQFPLWVYGRVGRRRTPDSTA